MTEIGAFISHAYDAVFGGIPKNPKKDARKISAPNVDPTLALLNIDDTSQQKAMMTNP